MKRLVIVLALATLPACQNQNSGADFLNQLKSFTAADVASALSLAQAGDDQPAMACWSMVGRAVGQPLAPGVATGIELARLGSSLTGPCSGILRLPAPLPFP